MKIKLILERIFISLLFGLIYITASAQEKKPNLVFVFSDQQSFDMLGCYGNKQIKTPNIDKLAEQGIRFRYCISNQPVCTPYRGMLMTGQHPLYNGAFSNDIQLIPENGTTFAQSLKSAGYSTAYFGKWHLYGGNRNRNVPPGPHRMGFDQFSTNNCMLIFGPESAFYFNEKNEKVKFNEWEAYGQTHQAIDFIEKTDKKKPFALFVSYHPPHDQGVERNGPRRYNTIPELMNLYHRDSIALRPTAMELDGSWGTTMEELKTDYHGYYSMSTGIDNCVGDIIKALSEKGELENTIFVYTSDHGDNLHSYARPWPKSNPEDYSLRVPLIISWPKKITKPQVLNQLIGTLDLMPTLLGLTDVEVPETCQGKDLSPIIKGEKDIIVESIPLFYFFPNWRGIFSERFTFSFDLSQEKDIQSWNVLYDRLSDPLQQHNLFYDPAYTSVRDSLYKETLEWMEYFKDPLISDEDLLELCGFQNTKIDADESQGILPGRPIDLILNSNKKGLIHAAMPDKEKSKILLERIRDREIKRVKGIYQEKINKLDGINPKISNEDYK